MRDFGQPMWVPVLSLIAVVSFQSAGHAQIRGLPMSAEAPWPSNGNVGIEFGYSQEANAFVMAAVASAPFYVSGCSNLRLTGGVGVLNPSGDTYGALGNGGVSLSFGLHECRSSWEGQTRFRLMAGFGITRIDDQGEGAALRTVVNVPLALGVTYSFMGPEFALGVWATARGYYRESLVTPTESSWVPAVSAGLDFLLLRFGFDCCEGGLGFSIGVYGPYDLGY